MGGARTAGRGPYLNPRCWRWRRRTVSQHPQPRASGCGSSNAKLLSGSYAPPHKVWCADLPPHVRFLHAPAPQVRCVSPTPLLRAISPSAGLPPLFSRRLLYWSSVPAPGVKAGVGSSFPGGRGVRLMQICPLEEPALQRRPLVLEWAPAARLRQRILHHLAEVGLLLPGEDGFLSYQRIAGCACTVGNSGPG